MQKIKFSELPLSVEVSKAVQEMGFEEATPIQTLAIPEMLKGKDVVGQAQTGTGKTAAFGIPIIEKINQKDKFPQAIILCPTRELAIQVSEELKKLAKFKRDINTLPVYGGQPIDRQIHALRRGVQVIIGTPGRVMDHLERGTLKLDRVRMVVLDEADEMLDMGFYEDIELILKSVPKERQTVFFSATMPKRFLELSNRFLKSPSHIKVVHDKLTVPLVDQIYYEVKETVKPEMLTRIIDIYDLNLALVFCNTKRKVDEVVGHLQGRGYFADAIHGDMSQAQRDRVMSKFRKGAVEILVATDVAARGIDVENVDAVINYDIPQDEEYYVHRIGRTGRAGKSGKAFSFVSGRDIYKLKDIQRYAKIEIKRKVVPTLKEVENVKSAQLLEKVKTGLGASDLGKYAQMIESLIGEEVSSLDVAAALLKMIVNAQSGADKKDAPEHDFAENSAEPGMVKLQLNLGKAHNVRPGDIVGAIAGETGLPGKMIGHIDIYERHTFIDIPKEEANNVINIMKTKYIKNK
ncbi:MAG: ATP-dependent RNA helicase, partial [Elusimicrobia bacterium RIFOXYA1_FULL_47_7]